MGFFDSFGSSKEKGIQLLIKDNRRFRFRKLPIEEHSLLEKNGNGDVIRGWAMFYKLQKRFDGFKRLGAGMITPCFERDIIYDPFNQLNDNEKPEKGSQLQKAFVTKIAEAKCYKHEKINPPFYMDKLTIGLVIAIVVLALCVGLKIAVNR